MRLVRQSAPSLALVLGLALLVPAPTSGQSNNQGRLIVGVDTMHMVPATDDQLIRVTVGNPSGGGAVDGSGETVIIVGAGPGNTGHVRRTLDPGASYTYTLDPRTNGQLVDPKWDLFHVPVRVQTEAETVEGRPAPQPSVTIEVVDARTGALQSVHVFPGFTGGVPVTTADLE